MMNYFKKTRMSFIRKAQSCKSAKHSLKLEMTPHPGVRVSELKSAAQNEVINQMHREGSALFKTHEVMEEGNTLRTNLSKTLAVADMIPAMREYDLVMKTNLHLDDGSSTCAMITADDLSNGEVDSRDGKFQLGLINGYVRQVSFSQN